MIVCIFVLVVLKPELCIRSSITSLTHFKSVALLCLPSHHSGAMLSKPNCLIYGDLKPHHESYCIIQVKPRLNKIIFRLKTALKHLANIQTGIFTKPVAKGDTVYLQPKYFDELGKLTTELVPDLNSIGIAEKHILKQGDVLFAAKGSKNFATLFDFEGMSAAASTSFFVIRIFEKNIFPAYLTWYLNHPKTLKYLKGKARGSSIASISKAVLSDLELPLPSIDNQNSIIGIDELRSTEKQLKLKIDLLREAQIQQQIFNALK